MRKGRYIRRRTASRMLTTVLALLLVVGLSVGGTLAWLTATTGAVTNTFTVGNIEIILDEGQLNEDGKTTDEDTRVTANNNYKVVPGGDADKTPLLTVKEGSEPCYVYVSIENNMLIDGKVMVTHDLKSEDWTEIGSTGNKKLYRYKAVVDAMNADQPLKVFENVHYDENITKENIGQLNGKTIVIMGYAHQSANVEQADADAAAAAKLSVPLTTT